MQQQTTSDSQERQRRTRSPLGQRLWRNQLGILLAVALTLAAAGLLLMSLQR